MPLKLFLSYISLLFSFTVGVPSTMDPCPELSLPLIARQDGEVTNCLASWHDQVRCILHLFTFLQKGELSTNRLRTVNRLKTLPPQRCYLRCLSTFHSLEVSISGSVTSIEAVSLL
jgi:hypothetical protein